MCLACCLLALLGILLLRGIAAYSFVLILLLYDVSLPVRDTMLLSTISAQTATFITSIKIALHRGPAYCVAGKKLYAIHKKLPIYATFARNQR